MLHRASQSGDVSGALRDTEEVLARIILKTYVAMIASFGNAAA
jgi:hypothetical protein